MLISYLRPPFVRGHASSRPLHYKVVILRTACCQQRMGRLQKNVIRAAIGRQKENQMHLKLFCPLIALSIAPSVALAQTHMPAHAGPPTAPSPSSPAYQSTFADYRPYKEPALMSWREANDRVRDAGAMQGHDMATMKSQSDDPHAGHDMSKMAPAMPDPADPARPGVTAAAEKASADHAGSGTNNAPTEDPHAGHEMSKMSPAKPRTAAPAASGASPSKKETNPAHTATPAQSADPHAGHDMSKMPASARKKASSNTDKAADHAAHGAPPPNQPKNKKERE